MKRHVILSFEVEARKDEDLPTGKGLAEGVRDALPKEWFDYQDDDDYRLLWIHYGDG